MMSDEEVVDDPRHDDASGGEDEHPAEVNDVATAENNVASSSATGMQSPPLLARPLRHKFAAIDDVILLRAVNAFRPWRAPAGTSNGIMKVFKNIALHCAQVKEFGVKKGGPALRTRFMTLVNQFRQDQCKSLRQSGTLEEFNERERLLQEISTQMDDWNERVTEEKQQKEAKVAALAKSGEVLKRLAMDELLEDEDDGDTSSTSELSSSTAPSSKPPATARRRKVTKTERVGAVSDALATAIKSAGEDETRKAEIEMQKLEFKREQAEWQRQHAHLEREYLREEAALRREHEEKEAERRRKHELAMEERRMENERQREKMMQDFVLKILNFQKQTR